MNDQHEWFHYYRFRMGDKKDFHRQERECQRCGRIENRGFSPPDDDFMVEEKGDGSCETDVGAVPTGGGEINLGRETKGGS